MKITEETLNGYVQKLELGYLETLKNLYHLPKMIEDVKKDIQELNNKKKLNDGEKNKLKNLEAILAQHNEDLKQNTKNEVYYKDTILYFKGLNKCE